MNPEKVHNKLKKTNKKQAKTKKSSEELSEDENEFTSTVKYVASRYRQVAALKAAKSKGNNLPHHGSDHLEEKAEAKLTNSTLDITPTILKHCEVQEENENFKENNQITSTPNSTNSGFSVSICDASAIAIDQSVTVPLLKENLFAADFKKKFKPKTDDLEKKNIKSVPVSALPKHQKRSKPLLSKSPTSDVDQEIRIKIAHSTYIQTAFLENRARKTLQIHSSRAMEQLFSLWSSNQILLEQIKTTDVDLKTICYLRHLQRRLNAQEAALEDLIHVMPALLQQYSEISDAVDSVRNKLPMTDISYFRHEKLEDDISPTLLKCGNLFESIHQSFSSDMDEFSTLSKLLSGTENLLTEMGKETKWCKELLSSTNALAVTEASLKIGEILCGKDENIK